MMNTEERVGSVRCWDDNCRSEEIEHRWMADPVRCRNLDEWKCNACGFRWARWSEPLADSA
jgi:hypothetical protein